MTRYTRQIQLIGSENQAKLHRARVLVVGVGGLGCPVLELLCSAGIGTLGLVDFDKVELHNLHRQFLFAEKDVQQLKTAVAVERLQARNSDTIFRTYPYSLSAQNVFAIIDGYDIVVDCTDNFAVRYLLSDACAIAGKSLVYGALYHYEGQVSVFNVEKDGYTTTYRDLFPTPPQPEEVPTCNEAGILPTVSSMIGHLQANEVLKLLLGKVDDCLVHTLLLFNTQTYQLTKIKYCKMNTSSPQTPKEVEGYNYPAFCHQTEGEELHSVEDLQAFLAQENSVLVDVREADEMPKINLFKALELPLSELPTQWEQLKTYDHICFVCVAGVRSMKALRFSKEVLAEKDLKSYKLGFSSLVK